METDADRTDHLLELMKKGDIAFNERDRAGMDLVHHPGMVAYVTGSPDPIRGRQAHAAAMGGMFAAFPDMHVYCDPYEVQFGRGDWITVVTRITGTFTGPMTLADGTTVQPTGKSFDIEDFVQTSKWDGDQLVAITASWDSSLQARQLGLA